MARRASSAGAEYITPVEPTDQWATRAWCGLCAYVLVSDLALGATGHPYMTDAWRDALEHPVHRWLVIVAWGLTTKHLFFPNFMPKVDPFSAIGCVAGKIYNRRRFDGI